MGFLSRSVSLLRYAINGKIEGPFWEFVDEGIRKGAFQTRDSSPSDVRVGWVSIDDFTDSDFKGTSYLRGSYIALALRIDTVRVPPRLLEMHVKREARKLLEETGRQRLSTAQRRELKDRVSDTLKSQVFPSIQIFDLIWDTAKSLAYFGSHSGKAREKVEDHFRKCFGLSLIPLIPYIRAQQLLTNKSDAALLEKMKPSSFL